jgi:hypothetical protein
MIQKIRLKIRFGDWALDICRECQDTFLISKNTMRKKISIWGLTRWQDWLNLIVRLEPLGRWCCALDRQFFRPCHQSGWLSETEFDQMWDLFQNTWCLGHSVTIFLDFFSQNFILTRLRGHYTICTFWPKLSA